MTPRPYQLEALAALREHLCSKSTNPCIVLPTGAGKSPFAAWAIQEYMKEYPPLRVAVLAHVQELVEQNAQKMRDIWAAAPIGIYSAGLGARDMLSPITFASIQSIWRKACDFQPFDLLIIDEAHRIPMRGEGMYRRFVKEARMCNPRLMVVGMTATPFRLDGGPICRKEYILNEVAYEANVKDLIDDGYLCRLRSKIGDTQPNLRGVQKSAGDYNRSQLDSVMNAESLVSRAVAEIVPMIAERKAILFFCVTVQHARHVSQKLGENGIVAPVIHAETPQDERQSLAKQFVGGKLRALCNVNVLSEGFDARRVDCIVMLRPTQSAGLYMQQVGRGLRIHESKTDCIAEGQLVLTDCGLVPIENVTLSMKVWDGIEFVSHCGVVCRGEQEVITYAGLTATADHKVWTEEGWQAFGKCAIQQTPIQVTGDGRTPIRKACCCSRGCSSSSPAEKGSSADPVFGMRRGVPERLHKSIAGDRWMQGMWKSATGSALACSAGNSRTAAMHQPCRSEIQRLRIERNSIQVLKPYSDGRVGYDEPRAKARSSNRQDKQLRALRAGEFEIRNSATQSVEHKKTPDQRFVSSVSSRASRNQVRRFNSAFQARSGHDGTGDHRAVLRVFQQAKRRVWDILNCGPRHRFTVEGLLVSNCLVLDFAGNIDMHGPIDTVKGQRPVLTRCPECKESYPKSMDTCPGCGWFDSVECDKCGHKERATFVRCSKCGNLLKFKACRECEARNEPLATSCYACNAPFGGEPRKINHDTKPSNGSILSSSDPWEVVVDSVEVERHEKYGDPTAPATLQVTYYGHRTGVVGNLVYHERHKEWVSLEHGGYAGALARSWWISRFGGSAPATVAEALERDMFLAQSIASITESIRVKQDGKYSRVIGVRLRNRTAVAAGK